jgi:hypothetical protein
VLDFVNPLLPLWGLIHQAWKLWLYESESRSYAEHWRVILKKKPRTVDAGASSTSKGEMMMARETIITV